MEAHNPYKEYQDRTKAIKEVIIRLLFEDKKAVVTEKEIKKEVHCYNVNIERVVSDINSSMLYPFINCVYDKNYLLSLNI